MRHLFSREELLAEALGVPAGIAEAARSVYDGLMAHLRGTEPQDLGWSQGDDNYVAEVGLEGPFGVGDLVFGSVTVRLVLSIVEGTAEPELSRSEQVRGYGSASGPRGPYLENLREDPVLALQIMVPEEVDFDDVVGMLARERRAAVVDIGHELMHAYDHHKAGRSSISSVAEYQVASGLRWGVPSLDRFMDFMYFVSGTENMVRPAEVSTDMSVAGTGRAGFREYLDSSGVVSKLREISRFDYDQMRRDLESESREVDRMLEDVGAGDTSGMQPGEKAELALRVVRDKLAEFAVGEFDSLLPEVRTGQQQAALARYTHAAGRRHVDLDSFYLGWQRRLRRSAREMLRRIARLYGTLP